MTNKTIHEYTEETSPAASDELLMWKAAGSVTRRATRANWVGATLTGGGTLATGGFTLTIPGTGTATLLEYANVIPLARYGFAAGNTAAANKTAIDNANTAALALSAPTMLLAPAGRFSVDNFSLAAGVLLAGARMPVYDYSSQLVGGTVIEGATITLAQQSGLMNLGVAVSTAKNAITGSSASDCRIINVAVLGSGTQHGMVFTSGTRNFIKNFFAAEFDHGIAIKGKSNEIYGLSCWNCGISSLTLKSDSSQDCTDNLIIGVESDGTAAGDAGGIWLDALSPYSVMYNTIIGLNLKNVGNGVYAKAVTASGFLCRDNRVIGGIVRSPSVAGINLGSAGAVAGDGPDYNDFSDITIVNSGGYSFLNQYGGENNCIHNGRSINPTSGDYYNTWRKQDINGSQVVNSTQTYFVQESVEDGEVAIVIRNLFSASSSTDETASLSFRFNNLSGNAIDAAAIRAIKEEDFTSVNTRSGAIAFLTNADGGGLTERIRITKLGNMGIGSAAPETRLHVDGEITLNEVAANPTTPTAGAAARVYIKGDKLIIQYNHGGTTKYRYLDLTSTDATWTYTTSAP